MAAKLLRERCAQRVERALIARSARAGVASVTGDIFSDMDAGGMVAQLRERHGLSQRALAVRASTSQAWISRVERGEISPSVDSLERLLHAMGEQLVLDNVRLSHDDTDRHHRATTAAMDMPERLERALSAASFAAELHGRARDAR
jgi:transcriptional regulator with XRE-family HTH domain